MNIALLALLQIAFFSLRLETALSTTSCISGWSEYSLFCFRSFLYYRTFEEARSFCRIFDGDLVSRFTKSKLDVLKENRHRKDTGYFVGIADFDKDGTYTDVKGRDFPVATWPELAKSRRTNKDDLCVKLQYYEKGFTTAPCNLRSMFICETFKDDKKSLYDVVGKPCQLDKKCTCRPQEWFPMPHHNKYIRINVAEENYTTSRAQCEQIGARLYVIPDDQSLNIISDIFSIQTKTKISVWIGLTRKDNIWFWDDGKPMTTRGFEIWENKERGNCGQITVDSPLIWEGAECSDKKFSICESVRPCSVTLVMYVNKEEIREDTNISLSNEQLALIKCESIGFPQRIQQLSLYCGKTIVAQDVTFQPTIVREIHMNVSFHNRICSCQLAFEGHKIENKISVQMHVKTRPLLVNKGDNNRTYWVSKGKAMSITFDIYANPRPDTFDLSRKGLGHVPRNYLVSIEPHDNLLQYTVYLSLNNIMHHETGGYSLMIKNCVEGYLKFNFVLDDSIPVYGRRALMLQPAEKHTFSSVSFILGIIFIIAVLILAVTSDRFNRGFVGVTGGDNFDSKDDNDEAINEDPGCKDDNDEAINEDPGCTDDDELADPKRGSLVDYVPETTRTSASVPEGTSAPAPAKVREARADDPFNFYYYYNRLVKED